MEKKRDDIRVLLVDDCALYREGLAELVGRWEGFCVAGEASDGREAIELCRSAAPDVVLMDVQMPVMDGVEATAAIHGELPELPIIMLTVTADEGPLFDAIRSGARGYILKNTHARQLKSRIREVLDGGCALSSEVAASVMEKLRNMDVPERSPELGWALEHLTEQERDILRYVAAGESNREIGERLFLSESTVKKQLSAILLKLGLSNRVQAATFALKAGIAS